MALMTWWQHDPLPKLTALPGFTVRTIADNGLIAALNRLDQGEILARRRDGHTPYVALLNGIPAAYGWSATRQATIGELNLHFTLPRNERYFWDFATLPAFRGLGIYPRLLQAMLRAERPARAWIIHAPENLPSGTGMSRAGLSAVGRLSFRADSTVALAAIQDDLRAWWGAAMLGVPLSDAHVAACWCCARGESACGCWRPGVGATGSCCCAIPVGFRHRQAA